MDTDRDREEDRDTDREADGEADTERETEMDGEADREEDREEDGVEDTFEELHAHAMALHDTYEPALERLAWLHTQLCQGPDALEEMIRRIHEDALVAIATTGRNPFLERLLEELA
jgi:hypothetical protein